MEKKGIRKSAAKFGAMAIAAVWGAATLFAMCGEDAPGASTASFMLVKLAAVASFVGLAKFCHWADGKGLL